MSRFFSILCLKDNILSPADNNSNMFIWAHYVFSKDLSYQDALECLHSCKIVLVLRVLGNTGTPAQQKVYEFQKVGGDSRSFKYKPQPVVV